MADTRVQAGLKLEPEMVAALDAMAADHSAGNLARVTRADVMRSALAAAIAAHAASRRAAPARPRARARTL